MLFSSISFLFYYLPIVLILYLAVPQKAKNYVLLVSSIFFYAWGEPRYIVLMVVTILLGYGSGLIIERLKNQNGKKAVLIVSVCLCLGILGFFKYTDFLVDTFNSVTRMNIPLLRLTLPIGISFYTFQLISYIIDVYRGTTEAQKNPVKLAVYISMFPQLIAGPIVRYIDIKEQLLVRKISWEKFSYGVTRFCMGFGKKILLANTLGELTNVYKNQDTPTVVFTWMYAIATMLQIYFDFSGYSDMAIGLGSILGFDFPENFKHPFMSKNATEFWRRWHITLGSWFRDYLYFPMGGSRVNRARHFLNLFVVWMATGLWHGANWNFVLWGLFFAAILIIEKYGLLKVLAKSDIVGHIYCLLVVMISFIIFDNTIITEGFTRIGYLIGIGDVRFCSGNTLFYLKDYAVVLIIAAIGSTEFPMWLVGKLKAGKAGCVINILEPVFNLALLIIGTAFLINGSFNPFLYFRF